MYARFIINRVNLSLLKPKLCVTVSGKCHDVLYSLVTNSYNLEVNVIYTPSVIIIVTLFHFTH